MVHQVSGKADQIRLFLHNPVDEAFQTAGAKMKFIMHVAKMGNPYALKGRRNAGQGQPGMHNLKPARLQCGNIGPSKGGQAGEPQRPASHRFQKSAAAYRLRRGFGCRL
ncbi:hypothetical protein D3C76_1606080 [compost metagenome]